VTTSGIAQTPRLSKSHAEANDVLFANTGQPPAMQMTPAITLGITNTLMPFKKHNDPSREAELTQFSAWIHMFS